jgi:hypothetical protein
LGQPWQTLLAGSSYLSSAAQAASHIPAGHPEGYLEAFAVIYREFIADVHRVRLGEAPRRNYATVHDGLRGLRFVAKAVESSRYGGKWLTL